MKRLFGRRPSPAMVVAVVACVLGLTGQGVAQPVVETAANVSKDVLKLSKSANKRSKSALRTARRADKNAKAALAKGGPKGDKGDKGDQGDPGPFPDTLQSGKTLKGKYYALETTSAVGTYANDTVSFAYPLASTPTQNYIPPSGASTANCPGSESNPQAAPGNVCVYSAGRAGVNTSYSSDGIEFDQLDKYGFALNVNSSTSSSYFYDIGTWAVTAP